MHITLLSLLLACNGPATDDPTESDDLCADDPCADLPGTTCVDAQCVDVELALQGAGASFSGTWTPTAGGAPLRFEVDVTDSVATAALHTEAARVEVTLGADQALVITVGGVSFDGRGELSAEESAALTDLLASDLIDGLGVAPLRLGCADAELDPQAVAALLAPWQLLLKHAVADRAASARALALASSCAWFPELGGRPLNGVIQLDHAAIIPVVYGFFPFDDVGELPAVTTTRAAGDLSAACGARCRGACGGDCQPVNCDQVVTEVCDLDFNGLQNGYVIAALEHICGTAAGCQLHDDCYDTCNSQLGCGSWDAAVCRRGCDVEAIDIHGFENCQAWAMGLGPFEGTLHFTYPVDGGAARLDPATCPVPAGVLQWEDPPGSAPVSYADAVTYCEALVHAAAEDWRLPSMTELQQIERGCPINDCSAVDSCAGCALYSGPAESGCYWDPRLSGACTGYWTSSPFVYQAGMHWIEMFFSGGAAIGHDEQAAAVRCVRGAP